MVSITKVIKKLIYIVLAICLSTSSAAAIAPEHKTDMYRVRYELLIKAMDHIGVSSPEAAIEVWVKGLESRNAAIQYSVMSEELKKEYKKHLDQHASNWVTGMSSPSVDSYRIINVENQGESKRLYNLAIITVSSTGIGDDTYIVAVTVNREKGFWCITRINSDEGLYPYMGLWS